jgi:hypothetical protein
MRLVPQLYVDMYAAKYLLVHVECATASSCASASTCAVQLPAAAFEEVFGLQTCSFNIKDSLVSSFLQFRSIGAVERAAAAAAAALHMCPAHVTQPTPSTKGYQGGALHTGWPPSRVKGGAMLGGSKGLTLGK